MLILGHFVLFAINALKAGPTPEFAKFLAICFLPLNYHVCLLYWYSTCMQKETRRFKRSLDVVPLFQV